MERGNFFPLPAPSSALYFLEGPLVTHYSWALTVAVGKKCCPFDQGKSKAEEGSVAGRSAPSARSWRIAGIPGVLPWLCRDGAACASTQGRSVTQRLAVRCPVTLAMLLEKTRRGTGMQGGRAAEKLLWGEGGSWRGSCGWWEQWGKAVPLHKLSLVSTKLPWPKRGGGSRGRRGAGGVCNQVMDGLG